MDLTVSIDGVKELHDAHRVDRAGTPSYDVAYKSFLKAKEMGLTLEEYKAYKKEEAKKRRYEREIIALEEQLEEIKKKIEYRKNYLNK